MIFHNFFKTILFWHDLKKMLIKKKPNPTSCHALIIKIYLPTYCENEDHKPICNY